MADQSMPAGPAALSGRYPKGRVAACLLFLANGLYIGAWSAKIPELSLRLSLTPQYVGLLLVAFGIGSLVIMPISGGQIARFGSSAVLKVTSLLFLPVLLIITFAPNVYVAAVGVFLYGGFAGAMDVAMNANAVEVEKAMRKSIMSSCHAFWSLGALLGAGTGGFLIDHFGETAHALIATAAAALAMLIAFPSIMQDAPHHEAHQASAERASIFRSPLPWLLGVVALFCMLQEGIVIDWSALFLNRELSATLTIAALGSAAFYGTMTVMRFVGDGIRDRLGAVRTMQISGVFAFVGMMIAGLAPNSWLAVAGFAISGLGVSNLVPIAFSAAGNLPGMAKGMGLSVVTVMGYSGTLFAPTMFGFVVEHTGYRAIYIATPLLLIVVLALSGLMRYADSTQPDE